MRLKSIELHGFKSFPDKTVLNVEHGVTIVVGPNGSGKSNISDAVRWVLGELSSKNLRSTKMEDVIFGGTASRGPMSFCEVSLVIDNSDSENRLLSDYDEVTVTRRFYRSGESDYMLNRKSVRLKDIYELFMNTGVGKTGYSIIGQGKVAEIISQKSDERRQIFEEAAGISKYRHKKNEAEKKLKETGDNILRITDILGELKQRVGPLERESKKAVQYVELFEKKKAADIALWIYDTDKLRGDIRHCEDAYNLAAHEFEMADDSVKAIETQSDKLYMTVQENNARAETLSNQIRSLSEKMYSTKASFEVLENDIDHLKLRRETALSEKKAKEAELANSRIRIASLEENCTALGQKALEYYQNDTENTQKLEEIQRLMDETDDKIRLSENNISEASGRVTEAKIELSSIEGSSSSMSGRCEEIKADIAAISQDIAMISEKIEKSEKTIAEYTKRRDDFLALAEKAKAEADKAKNDLSELSLEISHISNEISVKSQKVDNLKRLEDLFEGYSHSVKFIMDRAERKQIFGIHGPVSKMITVEGAHALAIETALGANVQNIIVDDESAAKNAISLLKRENAGRATFYPITSIKPSALNISESKLASYKGFVGVASDLTKCDAKYKDIISYLLGRTLIFDNLDNASAMSKDTGFKFRAVTLDGQIINAGGSYTGGSAKRDSGIFTRAYEIEKLTHEIEKAESLLTSLQGKLAELDKTAQGSSAEFDINRDNASILASLIQAETTQLEVLKSRLAGDNEQKESLDSALSALENQDTDNASKQSAAREKIAMLEKELDFAESEHDKLLSELTLLGERLDNAQSEINALRLTSAELRKDIQVSERDLEAEKERAHGLEESIEELASSVEAISSSIAENEDKITQNRQNVDVYSSEIEEFEKEREQLIILSGENEKKLNSLREKLRDLTRQREELIKENTKLESKRNAMLAEQDKRIEKLYEEYELTYSTALELGYEPVTPENHASVSTTVGEYKRQIKALGNVNTNAIEEYKEVKERFEFLSTQHEDLIKSQTELVNIITKIESEMRTRFTEAITNINKSFKKVFAELFGGGTAEIVLTDPEHVLESGIDINVAPPGKIIKSLTLLSGGEQAFVAIALFFAILNVNPTPFCILDEIEAALDEVNVQRFAEYIKHYSDNTQFIVITHRRGTMNAADTLYGITMQERGISKIFTLDVNDAEEKIGERL